MGNSPAKQALEDFARSVRTGDVTGVERFLRQMSAARGPGAPADKVAQELRSLDLNNPLPEGLTALQLAASCGRAEVVRCLLDTCRATPELPDLDPNAADSRRRTALHVGAAFKAPPGCAQCVVDLLSRQADPCIADCDGRTPLDVARNVRCTHCVRALEDNVKVWQGWVEHDEHSLLSLPAWRTRWLVVCQDRYPNTGAWREASSVSVSCYNCHTVLRAPAYAYRLRCTCCSAEVAVTTSLQLALYDDPRPGAGLPGAAAPSVALALPTAAAQISAKALEDAGLRSFAGALFEGKLRRALQSTGGTSRVHGFTMKVLDAAGRPLCEHSFRTAAASERDRLLELLRDPARAAFEAACARAAPRAPAPAAAAAGAAAPPAPWSCPRCTYAHTEAEAALLLCAVCGAERGPPGPPPCGSLAQPPEPSGSLAQLPEPSAPPLADMGPQAAALADMGPKAAAAATTPEASASAPPPSAPPVPASAAASVAQAPPSGEEDDSGMCVVCLERPADTAVVPCGHMCGCFQCLQGLRGAPGAQCPMCRGPISSTIRIYKS